jgi:hypothetical protein
MGKDKFIDKMKEGMSVNEIESFARKHITESFSILALVIAAISSSFDFFTGPKFSILFLVIGAIAAILFPLSIEKMLKQLYSFTFKQEKMTEVIFGALKLIIALFIPFIYFGFIGLLAGSSYHYFIRYGQILKENNPKTSRKAMHDDEHE